MISTHFLPQQALWLLPPVFLLAGPGVCPGQQPEAGGPGPGPELLGAERDHRALRGPEAEIQPFEEAPAEGRRVQRPDPEAAKGSERQ